MADKYKSLKVKELQEILQKNGLPHTGKKEDLIDRLVKNDEKKALELTSFDDLAGLEEFEESKLEDLDSLTDLKSTATTTEKKQDETSVNNTTEATTKTSIETVTSEPTKDTTPVDASTTDATTEEEKKDETTTANEPPAEVVKPGSNFKYTPITFDSPKKAATTPKATKLPSTTTTTTTTAPATDSELERKIERAKRFNVDLDEKTKQQLRASRFGASAPKKIKNPAPVKQQQQQAQQGIDPEVLKKRAERFGIPSKEVEEERKRKRAERFGIPTKEAEEEKKRRRAERFNSSK